eukprot:CAMPEP_0172490772 /NCGR_PEP_ID=MMETSP1066-20121228/21330_1 /TAXON_ID=671091 /ORGANISM="Coscinodiscus wailesii, Strain CCMP2513" /LENGTH=311 /DNA_ID=CAMNT_0013259413 /DNA_START=83 /DNA_END=1015 /DNA_ORIENTATION=+
MIVQKSQSFLTKSFPIVTRRYPTTSATLRGAGINHSDDWWGRGGPPQKIPGRNDIWEGTTNNKASSAAAGDDGSPAATTTKKARRTPRAYKQLYRHDGPKQSHAACYATDDPASFLLKCNYTRDEVETASREFPALLTSLDVTRHLLPKIRFLIHTLGGGDTVVAVNDGNGDGDVLRVSPLGKSLPPQYFGCRLEKTLAPRHAYLAFINSSDLPYGIDLLRSSDGAYRDAFFAAASQSSSVLPFVSFCNDYDGRNRRHTVEDVEAFESLFRRGLLFAARGWHVSTMATEIGPGRLVSLLLEHGADPEERDR